MLFSMILVGLNGLEPSTSRLSGVRSNQLSYKPNLKVRSFKIKQSLDFNLLSLFVFSIGFLLYLLQILLCIDSLERR